MPDWIPPKDLEYRDFTANMLNVTSVTPANWNLSAGDVSALETDFNAWLSDFNTRTGLQAQVQALTASLDLKRKGMEFKQRGMNAKVQAPPPVSDANKITAGFPVRDTNPTPVPVPTTAPFVSRVEVRAAGELILHFRDQLTPDSRAKPAGVREAEIWSKVDAPAPADGSTCVYMGSDSATPYNAVFDVAKAGKPVWFCLRWKNTRGEVGPWGPVFAAMVPGAGGGE